MGPALPGRSIWAPAASCPGSTTSLRRKAVTIAQVERGADGAGIVSRVRSRGVADRRNSTAGAVTSILALLAIGLAVAIRNRLERRE